MNTTENNKYPKESLLVKKLANTVKQRMLEEMVVFQTICWSQSTGIIDEWPVPAAQKMRITYQYNAGVKNACANYVSPVATRNMGATHKGLMKSPLEQSMILAVHVQVWHNESVEGLEKKWPAFPLLISLLYEERTEERGLLCSTQQHPRVSPAVFGFSYLTLFTHRELHRDKPTTILFCDKIRCLTPHTSELLNTLSTWLLQATPS